MDIQLGMVVQINLNCTIGHDVSIGDLSTLSPSVHVSGNVMIGEEVFIDTGPIILNGTEAMAAFREKRVPVFIPPD